MVGDKFAWFTEQLEDDPNRQCITPAKFLELIEL